VVLTATAVTVALSSASLVRTGSQRLGEEVRFALSSIRIDTPCLGGDLLSGYAIAALTPRDVEQASGDFQRLGDDDLIALIADNHAKLVEVSGDRQYTPQDAQSVLDYQALLMREVQRRGMTLPDRSPSFAQSHAVLHGGGTGGDCGGGSGPTQPPGDDYRFGILDDAEVEGLRREMARMGDDNLRDLRRVLMDEMRQMQAGGDLDGVRKRLDALYLLVREIEARGLDDPRLPTARAEFEAALAEYTRASSRTRG
jgi:hypothetical protein